VNSLPHKSTMIPLGGRYSPEWAKLLLLNVVLDLLFRHAEGLIQYNPAGTVGNSASDPASPSANVPGDFTGGQFSWNFDGEYGSGEGPTSTLITRPPARPLAEIQRRRARRAPHLRPLVPQQLGHARPHARPLLAGTAAARTQCCRME